MGFFFLFEIKFCNITTSPAPHGVPGPAVFSKARDFPFFQLLISFAKNPFFKKLSVCVGLYFCQAKEKGWWTTYYYNSYGGLFLSISRKVVHFVWADCWGFEIGHVLLSYQRYFQTVTRSSIKQTYCSLGEVSKFYEISGYSRAGANNIRFSMHLWLFTPRSETCMIWALLPQDFCDGTFIFNVFLTTSMSSFMSP